MSSKIKTVAKSTKKKSKRRSDINFESYIVKDLKEIQKFSFVKQVHIGINRNTVVSIDRILLSLADKIIERILWLNNLRRRKTITVREVYNATRLVLPDELKKHAISESVKAITLFDRSVAERSKRKISAKAQLIFPVSRVKRLIKIKSGGLRVGLRAAISLTSTLDFITRNILELAGNVTRDLKKKRISDRILRLAIGKNEELNNLFKKTLVAGGVISNVDKEKKEEDRPGYY